MRRLTVTMILGLTTLVATAAPAMAQQPAYPPSQSPAVEGASGAVNQSGTAFTGGGPTFPMFLAVALFVLGTVALFVARRRAQRLAG